ncbi:hypothetical protein GCM10010335_23450 [Streptomyces galbus]|nr:hypothetical protein GCM10010335_23450 [Streptomyces galbus]
MPFPVCVPRAVCPVALGRDVPASLPHDRAAGKEDGGMAPKMTDTEWRAFVSGGVPRSSHMIDPAGSA